MNSQVRFADWDEVHGTHQGQRLKEMPQSKAGQRTVLTSRAIRAFFPGKADAIHTGRRRLMPARQTSRRGFYQIAEHLAGPRHDFRKAAVPHGKTI